MRDVLRGWASLWLLQTFIVIVNVAEKKRLTVTFKSHAVFIIHISLINARRALYRMAAESGVAVVGVQQSQGFINLTL